jgi:hypothetical protein
MGPSPSLHGINAYIYVCSSFFLKILPPFILAGFDLKIHMLPNEAVAARASRCIFFVARTFPDSAISGDIY